MGTYPPHYAYPSAPALYRTVPAPPRLHWGWVLFFSVITLGLFGSVWLLVQSIWLRKVRGKSRALVYAIINVCALPVMFVVAIALGVVLALKSPASVPAASKLIGAAYRIIGILLYVFTAFTMRSEMEQEPIGIPLGGVMTFFFAAIYFQYHLRDYGVSGTTSGGPMTLGLQETPSVPQGVLVPSPEYKDQNS